MTGAAGSGSGSDASAGGRPPLVVIDGDASPEEVAAILAALATSGPPAGMPSSPVRHHGWASHERAAGAPRRPGPTAWRASSLPG